MRGYYPYYIVILAPATREGRLNYLVKHTFQRFVLNRNFEKKERDFLFITVVTMVRAPQSTFEDIMFFTSKAQKYFHTTKKYFQPPKYRRIVHFCPI